MRTKDTILLEQAYDRVVLRNQMLNEDVINDLTSKVWNTFKQKFPQVTQGINQAILSLFKDKNLEKAGDIIGQSLNSSVNEDAARSIHQNLINAVGSGLKTITPYVQAVQGLAGAVAEGLPRLLNIDVLTNIINPSTFIDTVINAILKVVPDVMTTGMQTLTSLANNTLGPDDQADLAKDPTTFFVKKVGFVVLFLLLAYGAKRYAQKYAQNNSEKEELQKTQDEFQKNAAGLE